MRRDSTLLIVMLAVAPMGAALADDRETTLAAALVDPEEGLAAELMEDLATPYDQSELGTLLAATTSGQIPRSRSVGAPHEGQLERGVRIASHPAFAVREPARSWVTRAAARWLVEGFEAVPLPGPKAVVLDASLRSGGAMTGHRSHQSGRDVDLTYFQQQCGGICRLKPIEPKQLDADRQWALLRHWLEQRQVEFIFVDYALQAPLYEAARRSGATERQLSHWFQWPAGASHAGGIVRHVDNHRDHLHVRFRCASDDRSCEASRAPVASRSRERAQQPNGLDRLLVGEDEDVAVMRALLE